ncbi:MAG: flap structure-specific endonuclease, partial [Candidatus Kariarchaeum pelagius]
EEYEKALKEGDLVRARKFATRANYLTSDMIDDAKKLLSLMGIPVIDAPGEGEAQAAQLSIEGQVYGAATQDYDALLFG